MIINKLRERIADIINPNEMLRVKDTRLLLDMLYPFKNKNPANDERLVYQAVSRFKTTIVNLEDVDKDTGEITRRKNQTPEEIEEAYIKFSKNLVATSDAATRNWSLMLITDKIISEPDLCERVADRCNISAEELMKICVQSYSKILHSQVNYNENPVFESLEQNLEKNTRTIFSEDLEKWNRAMSPPKERDKHEAVIQYAVSQYDDEAWVLSEIKKGMHNHRSRYRRGVAYKNYLAEKTEYVMGSQSDLLIYSVYAGIIKCTNNKEALNDFCDYTGVNPNRSLQVLCRLENMLEHGTTIFNKEAMKQVALMPDNGAKLGKKGLENFSVPEMLINKQKGQEPPPPAPSGP